MSGIDPFFDRDGVTIHVGDCRDVLRQLRDCSVNCCVTSPPYWGLRDYNHAGQIGLEQTPEDYIAEMVAVFREVRRVLRDDGTLWLNLGDSYARSGGSDGTGSSDGATGRGEAARGCCTPPIGLKPKDLVGIPWRVAFALQADGWYLRQDIIWHKPNPMPESVTDRCTKAHEYIFLLAKSERYYYDAEAVKEPSTMQGGAAASFRRTTKDHLIPNQSAIQHRLNREDRQDSGTRNRRSVWTVATKPYSGAHFATFPPALIEPCIQAGTSERGCCPKCLTPWERIVEKTTTPDTSAKGSRFDSGKTGTRDGGDRTQQGDRYLNQTVGWRPGCTCGGDPVPCTVLDPFLGSGTTAEVARRHGCRCIGIELNSEYAELAVSRFRQRSLLMADAG